MFRDASLGMQSSFESIGGISQSTKAAENANAANETRDQVMGVIVSGGAQKMLPGFMHKLGLGRTVEVIEVDNNSSIVRWVKARRGDLSEILRQGLNDTYTVTPEAA